MTRRAFLSLSPLVPGCKPSGSEPSPADPFPGCDFTSGPIVYDIWDTIWIGPAQDMNLLTRGVNVWNWRGPPDKPMVVIDSCMNCNISLPLLVYGGEDVALRISPENPVPIDHYPIFIESKISCEGVINDHPFSAVNHHSYGVRLIGEYPILCSNFHFKAIANFGTNICLTGRIRANRFRIDHLHTNLSGTWLLDTSESVQQNIFELIIGIDQGAKGVEPPLISEENYVRIIQRDPS